MQHTDFEMEIEHLFIIISSHYITYSYWHASSTSVLEQQIDCLERFKVYSIVILIIGVAVV